MSENGHTQGPEFLPAYKNCCPVTALPFFMEIEHPEYGMVQTYGGPFDSYTLPYITDGGDVARERFDHDEGGWLVDESETLCCGDCMERIIAAVKAVIDKRTPLIAAAPDLLAACEDAVHEASHGNILDREAVMLQIEKAIAKAKGKLQEA